MLEPGFNFSVFRLLLQSLSSCLNHTSAPAFSSKLLIFVEVVNLSSVMLRRLKRLFSSLLVLSLVLLNVPVIPSQANATIEDFRESFENGIDIAVKSGGASLSHVSNKYFEGNEDGYALYVSNRVIDWDAADFSFSSLGMENGKTYAITVTGFVDEGVKVPKDAKAVLSTNMTYQWLSNVDYVAGKAFTLTAKYTVDAESDSALRIQSNPDGASVPFYIGEIVIVAEPETTEENEIYHETFEKDIGYARRSGDASLTHVSNMFFEGNEDGGALYVSNRVNNWDAADFYFDDVGIKNGETYKVTVKGYVEQDVTTGAAIWVQLVESDYPLIAQISVTTGDAFTVSGEFTADTGKYKAIRIKTNDDNPDIPFYIGDIRIVRMSGEAEEPSRAPAEPFTPVDFEDGTDNGFTGRAGSEKLTVTEEANHTEGGKYALKVEGRTSSWHGPQIHVEKNIDKGSEYRITVWVKLLDPEVAEITLSTQIGNGSGASYPNLQKKTVRTSDGWVQFEATYRYTSVGNEFVTIYVESSNATASYYIDDISFEPTGSDPADIERDLTPIKDVYKDYFLIGNVISADTLEDLKFELLNMHFNAVTAENAMKPEELQKEKGKFTFNAADKLVNTALAEGLKVHGHVLVWHQQSPDWMNIAEKDENGNPAAYLSREEALDNMKTHIRTVMEHFGDRVISWDVVNEAMADNPPNPQDWKASLRQSPWYHAIGSDFVEQAFLEARAVLDEHPDWDIKLYYNDYNLDNQRKAMAVYNMVKDINDRYAAQHDGKLLIDGIGMQGHYALSTNPANVELSLKRFISLGVEVSISELDIRAGSNSQLPENLAVAQGYLYAQLFDIFRNYHEHIARITFWGLDDGSSWRASENPLLFDRNLQAKPAYYGVINPDKFMVENPPETPPDANQATAAYTQTPPVIDGIADAVWSSTSTLPITRYQMAWQGATGTARVLWDEANLYVLFEVNDTQLDKTSPNAWEQDSVEAFVDENNGKTSFYQEDDGQYRVNFDNEASFNPANIEEGFESATRVSGTSYTVEMKIPFKAITPANGHKIGFDAQINDGENGARQSVATWNDTTGNAYQDTSVFGVLTLTKSNGSGSSSGSSGSSSSALSPRITAESDGVVRINPIAYLNGMTGEAVSSISPITFRDALTLAQPDAAGSKTIRIVVGEVPGASRYTLNLPAEALAEPEAGHQLMIETPIGSVLVPGQMFTSEQIGDGQNMTLSIGMADTSSLSEDLRSMIGGRPVIELHAQVDGKAVSWNNPDAPVTVSIRYTPTDEELRDPEHITIWYMDGSGNVVPVPNARYNPESGMVTFITHHFSKFAVVFVKKAFSDSGLYPWAQMSIDILASKGILAGATETLFKPGDNITRGEFVSGLVKALGLSASFEANFDDVYPGHAYYNEIGIARKLGITNGIGGNRFGIDLPLARQDMVVLADRALKAAGKAVDRGSLSELQKFSDAGLVAPYAAESMAAFLKEDLIVGSSGILDPNGYVTKASAAVLLYKIYDQ